MAETYLNKTGLSYFWGKLKSHFAPLASPALTGTPTAPTATAGTNTTQIATTAFVQSAIPASVKNPYPLVIHIGNTTYTYDGSERVEITITSGDGVSY